LIRHTAYATAYAAAAAADADADAADTKQRSRKLQADKLIELFKECK